MTLFQSLRYFTWIDRGRIHRVLVMAALASAASSARLAQAQPSELPAALPASVDLVIVSAAPDVPASLVARVRGEVISGGLALGTPSKATADSIWVVLRQSEDNIIAELHRTGVETAADIVTAPLPESDAAGDRVEAYSELALRTVERLRSYAMQLEDDKPRAPAPTAPPATAPALAASDVAASAGTTEQGARWNASASAGGAWGVIGTRATLLARVAMSRRVLRNAYAGLTATLPFPVTSEETAAGQAEVTHAWAGAEFGYRRRDAAGRFAGAALHGGVARSHIAGVPSERYVRKEFTLWSAMTAASLHAGLALSSSWVAQVELTGTTLLPRPGVRVPGAAGAAPAWIIPSATVGVAASW